LLDTDTLSYLRNSRNLLAFSSGGDSSALFHLLVDADIDFDIAHVNYHTRQQSDDEASYAITLAQKYSKKAYIFDAPKIDTNFEAKAREIRYDFFLTCIDENSYDTLLMAHHLGDRLEWFLMQLSKGAGLYELAGMKSVEKRDSYSLIRPLLHVSKDELKNYLHKHNIKYFEDSTNSDESYKRNYFRHNFSEPLLNKFSSGIKKSFEYLDEDSKIDDIKVLHVRELSYFKTLAKRRENLLHVDKILKQRGFIMRQGDKELLKKEDSHIVGRKYVVAITQNYTFIAPYKKSVMDKKFKDRCRKLKIPKKLRAYLSTDTLAFELVCSVL
jgi:tRNA(Ile)-lysidine synthase